MAKGKSKTFWVAREKLVNFYTGGIDQESNVLIYRTKPKAHKDTYTHYDQAAEKDVQVTDIDFPGSSVIDGMCHELFEAITGIIVEPGTTFKVRLERV